MLHITIPAMELWDEDKEEFITNSKPQTIVLEHSLVSISKWESRWNKPFLSKDAKTQEESIDYIRCMTITQNVDPLVYKCLTTENMDDVNNYIDAPMTATVINDKNNTRPNREIVTSELIYYWMIALNIPMECQRWHLNRLLTLIRVCDIKNQPPRKMSRHSILSRNAALNAARRKQFNTRG